MGTALHNLQSQQHDPAELDRCRKDPVYFYNNYIRKEGEKVLTLEEYNTILQKEFQLRLKKLKQI